MQPPAYLHVVRISAGWAICCQRCKATVATTRSRTRADWLAVIHPSRCAAELARLTGEEARP